MKQRICDRATIARKILKDRGDEPDAQMDAILYMLADGVSVKVYHDAAMGGMVVDIVE